MTYLRMEPFLGFSRMFEAYKGLRTTSSGTSLAVQGQRLCAPNAGDTGSIVGQEAKIPHAATEFAHRNYKIHHPECCK